MVGGRLRADMSTGVERQHHAKVVRQYHAKVLPATPTPSKICMGAWGFGVFGTAVVETFVSCTPEDGGLVVQKLSMMQVHVHAIMAAVINRC